MLLSQCNASIFTFKQLNNLMSFQSIHFVSCSFLLLFLTNENVFIYPAPSMFPYYAKSPTFVFILVPSLIALLSPFMSPSKLKVCHPSWLLIAIVQTHCVLNRVSSLLSAPKHLFAPVDQSSSISSSLTSPST